MAIHLTRNDTFKHGSLQTNLFRNIVCDKQLMMLHPHALLQCCPTFLLQRATSVIPHKAAGHIPHLTPSSGLVKKILSAVDAY